MKLFILDYTHTVGLGCDVSIPNISTMNPNSYTYFCGLIIALLIQCLVIYDYFFNYTICSQFFVWSKWKDVQFVVNKYSLKPTTSIIIDKYYWPTVLPILLFESSFCFIGHYFFNKSFLYLSIFIWTISFLLSFFSITFINFYIRDKEDLMVALRIREGKILLLEKEIENSTMQWRTEEMEKHKENYDESILLKRVEDYRTIKMRVIDEILNTKNTFLIDTLQNIDFQYEGTPFEWFLTPTHQNSVNICLYFYYLYICCQDSVYLYNLLYNSLFDYPPIGDAYIDQNNILLNSQYGGILWKIVENSIFWGF